MTQRRTSAVTPPSSRSGGENGCNTRAHLSPLISQSTLHLTPDSGSMVVPSRNTFKKRRLFLPAPSIRTTNYGSVHPATSRPPGRGELYEKRQCKLRLLS
ncbi:hypothetical protein LSAT2_026506 [Lamellibrachia satsuma]|nr:hypothetical protein LSAT2_026506 [Lamellibrachia satsuma]